MEKRKLFIQWDSTNDCNLSCNHCYHNREGNQTHIQNQNQMDLNDVKFMIDDLYTTARRWNMTPRFHASGGEPLMRRDLMEILDYTKSHGISTRLLTNGTLIKPKIAKKLFQKGIRRLQISVDGKRETHNKN